MIDEGTRAFLTVLRATRRDVQRVLARAPLGALASLVAGLVVAALLFHRLGVPVPEPPVQSAVVAPVPVSTPVPAPSQRDFADLVEAGGWVQSPMVALANLPADLLLKRVQWFSRAAQGVDQGQASARRGIVEARYITRAGATAIILEQGPGIGVTTTDMPDGWWGEYVRDDGIRLLWVRGHRVREVESCLTTSDRPWACPMVGTGSEVRVGTANGPDGWRLTSNTLTLDELLGLAAQMTRIEPPAAMGSEQGSK